MIACVGGVVNAGEDVETRHPQMAQMAQMRPPAAGGTAFTAEAQRRQRRQAACGGNGNSDHPQMTQRAQRERQGVILRCAQDDSNGEIATGRQRPPLAITTGGGLGGDGLLEQFEGFGLVDGAGVGLDGSGKEAVFGESGQVVGGDVEPGEAEG